MWFSCSVVRSIHRVQSHAALIEKCGDQRHCGFGVCQARIEGDAIPCAEAFCEFGGFFDTLKTLAIDEKQNWTRASSDKREAACWVTAKRKAV